MPRGFSGIKDIISFDQHGYFTRDELDRKLKILKKYRYIHAKKDDEYMHIDFVDRGDNPEPVTASFTCPFCGTKTLHEGYWKSGIIDFESDYALAENLRELGLCIFFDPRHYCSNCKDGAQEENVFQISIDDAVFFVVPRYLNPRRFRIYYNRIEDEFVALKCFLQANSGQDYYDLMHKIQGDTSRIETYLGYGENAIYYSNAPRQEQNEVKSAAITSPNCAKSLKSLQGMLLGCQRCSLHEQRHNIVFGTGNRHAKLMFIGEAPSAEDDLSGKVFSGKIGVLMNNILKAMNLSKDDVYFANILKCCTPGCRSPQGEEINNCIGFLQQQIKLIQPEIIVSLGTTASQTLLNVKDDIKNLRGHWYSYSEIPVMPTYHPAFLLQNEYSKKETWEDLKKVLEKLKKIQDEKELIKDDTDDDNSHAEYWSNRLCDQPQFAYMCDKWYAFSGSNWSSLLRNQPQFADKCDWSKLDESDWNYLLQKQPQFADRCNKWDNFSGQDWGYLLRAQPQFADICAWNKLDGDDWTFLLRDQPQFANQCDWSKLNGSNWHSLLRDQPQFADICAWNKLNGETWSYLLRGQPQFADRCDWSKLDGSSWSRLLQSQPSFADKCDWNKLDGRDWGSLLQKQPQFADKCAWNKLDGRDWGSLLLERPQFANKCDWCKLDAIAWRWIFQELPQFADKCVWNNLDGEIWSWLLSDQPQFADRCDWGKLDGRDWSSLLQVQPQFADKCDWGKLDGVAWRWLLRAQPQFADKRKKNN